MKKVSFALIVLLCLTACGKYNDYDFIDEKDPVDERAVIERAMDEQRTMMKPGFLTEHDFNLSFLSIEYNQQTEELRHRVNVDYVGSDAFLAFEAEKNTSEDRYEEKLEEMNDAKPLDNHTGYVGLVEEDGEKRYDFAIHEDDTFYYFERGWEVDEGYDEKLVKLLGESLKTEEDGAYSYFYDHFGFELDDLHFPLMSKDAVENIEVEINDLGFWASNEANIVISVTYDLGDDTAFTYEINGIEMLSGNETFVEKEEGETDHGITVTTYEDEVFEDTILAWEEDDYSYSITTHIDDTSLSTDDIYAIVDSSRDDDRSFARDDIFDPINEEPNLSDRDQDVLTHLEKIADDIQLKRNGE